MNNLLSFKSFIKFLSKNKVYTAIDIFGLSVSLMFVILIAVYTVQELSTDKFHEKGDRIYVLCNENAPATGAAVAYKVKERYPEIEKVCPVVAKNFDGGQVVWGDKKINADLLFADSTFFDLFDFRLTSGSRELALSSMGYAVISESFARKMFGTEDPMGKPLLVSDTISVIVNGVVEDMLHSALPDADVIVRWEQVACLNGSLGPNELGNAGGTTAFFLVKEGVDFSSRAEDMHTWFKTFFWVYERDMWKEVRLVPLNEFYFSGIGGGWPLNAGDRQFVLILMSVGFLVLIFAVINYINLTVAQAGFRAKEMATRRLMGSTRMELFLRLIMEATLLTLLSLLIGVLLAVASVSFVNDLLQTHIDLSILLSWPWVLAIVAAVGVVGVLSGLLPALVVSASKPIEVVRGTFRTRTKMVFSKFFITFQNAITITMIAASIVMISQIKHMMEAPLGFRTTNIMTSESIWDGNQLDAYIGELRQRACVKHVGKTRGLPLFGSNNWSCIYEEKNISFQQFLMDREAFDMLGLELLRDNKLTTKGWFLSEQAMRQMNLPEDTPSFTLKDKDPISVAGILRDFRQQDIRQENHPVMFRFLEKEELPWMLVIEVEGNPFDAYKEVAGVYEKMTGLEFGGKFMDEQLQDSFASQMRTAKIIVIFSIVAILISMLGLLAMSTYFIQQRSSEVAVRKVFGSSNKEILIKLVFAFLNYVLIAFVIAIPVIWYFMKNWLSGYSYRIELSPLIFIAAGLFCLLISFVTVFWQSYKAANTNPVNSFRNKM